MFVFSWIFFVRDISFGWHFTCVTRNVERDGVMGGACAERGARAAAGDDRGPRHSRPGHWANRVFVVTLPPLHIFYAIVINVSVWTRKQFFFLNVSDNYNTDYSVQGLQCQFLWIFTQLLDLRNNNKLLCRHREVKLKMFLCR